MLLLLHEVLLDDIQILSGNIYKNLDRIDFTTDLMCETWPNMKDWSRFPSQAVPHWWWPHILRTAQEHLCSKNGLYGQMGTYTHGTGAVMCVLKACYLEKIKCWFSHVPLKHAASGGNMYHKALRNKTLLVSLQDLIQKGASDEAL